MSTFNGLVDEFPHIRIDFFRPHPSKPPPLACFLSHIHTDHLQGLESLKSPFVYCSAATRRLLLRMEKYPHRMNFAKGVLEVRKQHYRHLQFILKAIPLQTPTELELGPKTKIRVSLFDANHCPGAVMFLIEGGGKAILYTGDVRAEPWWVNSVVRNPVLIPYTFGKNRLDCMYLDTTFATKEDVYLEFPSKAAGLQELLCMVQSYPRDTIFYIKAWTLGYEDVWVSLSSALGSRVHVDDYQSRLYRSLSEDTRGDGISVQEAPALTGFQAGNHHHAGCLTGNSDVRIHSCEPGTSCHGELLKKKNVVWISPIITRSKDGVDVLEIGAGGGGADFYQRLKLDVADKTAVQALMKLCEKLIEDESKLSDVLQQLTSAQESRNLRLSLEDLGLDPDLELSIQDFVGLIASTNNESTSRQERARSRNGESGADPLPDTIHFPYSRHSSYNELRHLVSIFKPKDLYPCTVDEETWTEHLSMKTLFGDLCSEDRFQHDLQLHATFRERANKGNHSVSRKRKHIDPLDTQDDEYSEAFETAHCSISHDYTKQPRNRPDEVSHLLASTPVTETPRQIIAGAEADKSHHDSPPNERLEVIQKAFREVHGGRDTVSPSPSPCTAKSWAAIGRPSTETMVKDPGRDQMTSAITAGIPEEQDASQSSLPMSAFDSQSEIRHQEREWLLSQLDGTYDHQEEQQRSETVSKRAPPKSAEYKQTSIELERRDARREAYGAARQCLLHGSGSGRWDDLTLRSVGRRGHIDSEVEL